MDKNEVILVNETLNLSDLELRIKEVAKEEGLKMKDIAKKAGMEPSYFSRISTGKKAPNCKVISKIADVMNVPVHRIIEAPKGFGHFYVDGIWEGIRKK